VAIWRLRNKKSVTEAEKLYRWLLRETISERGKMLELALVTASDLLRRLLRSARNVTRNLLDTDKNLKKVIQRFLLVKVLGWVSTYLQGPNQNLGQPLSSKPLAKLFNSRHGYYATRMLRYVPSER